MGRVSPKLLVSTFKGFYVVDTKDRWRMIIGGFGPYYGITWDSRYYYVAAMHGESHEETEVDTLHPDFTVAGRRKTRGLGNVHQMVCHGDLVYVANTRDEQVVAVDPNLWGRGLRVVFQAEERAHLNSVWLDDKGRAYVGEHRWGPSVVQVFHLDDALNWRRLGTFPIGEKIHNVYCEGKYLYVCNSEAASILQMNLYTGAKRNVPYEFPPNVWVRGLARTRERWYVGLSQRGDLEVRYNSDGQVYELDNDWVLQKVYTLPGAGNVTEVRALGVLDLAHNPRGYVWKS
jgi:hypothetical protein